MFYTLENNMFLRYKILILANKTVQRLQNKKGQNETFGPAQKYPQLYWP